MFFFHKQQMEMIKYDTNVKSVDHFYEKKKKHIKICNKNKCLDWEKNFVLLGNILFSFNDSLVLKLCLELMHLKWAN